ncbi:MAG: hypothetical protein J0M00_02540 [Burkholderiales bacterium]|nr:hypothetical protein [Burkholderiales bacterium]
MSIMAEQALATGPDTRRRAAIYNAVAVALLVAGLASADLIDLIAPANKFAQMELMARILAGALFVLLIATLLGRNRTAVRRAKERLVIAGLAFAACLSVIALAGAGQSRAADFMKALKSNGDEFKVKFAEIERSIDELDWSRTLSADTLATREGIAEGKATVQRFRKLLAERSVLVQARAEGLSQLLQQAPGGKAGEDVRFVVERTVQFESTQFELVGRAQSAFATAVQNLLDWSERNPGAFTALNGQVVFASAEKESEVRAFLAAIRSAEESVASAVEAAEAEGAKVQASFK